MADVNVYDSITISELIEINPYLIEYNDSLTITDSASLFRNLTVLNERVLLPFKESLSFNTEILQSHNRTEQRIALRQGIPDRRFTIKVVLESTLDISKFENKIQSQLKRQWAFPLWFLAETHTDTITAGDTSITVDTMYSGYQVNGFAFIWQDKDTYDVVSISNINSTTLNLYKTPDNTYTGTKYIMPCVSARCLGVKIYWNYDRAIVDLIFREERVNDVIDYSIEMTYDNKAVIKEPPISMSNRIDYSYDPDFAVLDAGTGLFDIVSNSDYNIVTQPYAWKCDSKQEAWELRQLFHYINGQQKGLLVPTFRNDLQLSQSVGAGDTSIYVVNTSAYEYMASNDYRNYIAFRPDGSDIIVRKILSIQAVSATEEKITIDVSPGTAFDANDYICWVDLCRLSDPTVNIEWYQRGKCIVEVELTRILDYTDPILEPYVYSEVGVIDAVNNSEDLGNYSYDSLTVSDDETVTEI